MPATTVVPVEKCPAVTVENSYTETVSDHMKTFVSEPASRKIWAEKLKDLKTGFYINRVAEN